MVNLLGVSINTCMDKQTFIQKSTNAHGAGVFDYSTIPDGVVLITDRGDRVDITCNICGHTLNTTVHAHLYRKLGCVKCRNIKTAARLTKTTDWFINEAIRKHGAKYIYTNTVYTGTKTKTTIQCPTHGEFLQTPNDHLSGCGCPYCGTDKVKQKLSSNTQTFINKAKAVHGDQYNYDKVVYTNTHSKVDIECPQHGIFTQKANSHLNGCGCPVCKTSRGEIAVKTFLDEHKIVYDYQHKITTVDYTLYLDFKIQNVVIEIDGTQHYKRNSFFHKTEEDFTKQIDRDTQKNVWCTQNGLTLHRVSYDGRNTETVINTVSQIILEHCIDNS